MAASISVPGVQGTTAKPATRWTAAVSRVSESWMQIPFLLGAGILLIGSIFLPYWNIVLRAPQYPKGLAVDVYVNKLEDMRSVREVDGLNHYIGMIKLTDAATIERAISVYAIPIVAILAVVSILLPGRWRLAARLPLAIYPIVFLVDLFAWLYYAGHSLDKSAALSSSISEFTPRIYGKGTIGQFSTEAAFEPGFWMSLAAMAMVIVTLVLDRRQRRNASPS